MSCVFCAIATGKASASVVLDEAAAFAFLDTHPLFKGHVLVVPPAHVETLGDLPSEEIRPFFSSVQRIARAVETALGAQGSFVAVNNRVSQSVPHLHVHVVPRTRGDGLKGFFWPRTKYESDAERDDYAARIAAALS
jgi:histidine triad (HIT) family protein